MSRAQSKIRVREVGPFAIAISIFGTFVLADDFAPKKDERQLSSAMHSEMSERPVITVGRAGSDVIGADNRACRPPLTTSPGWAVVPSRSAKASIRCATRSTFDRT